jgi:hypothetical protein
VTTELKLSQQSDASSYSGGRDQEVGSLKPAWANSSSDPILKKTLHKKGLVEWFKMKVLHSSPCKKLKLSQQFVDDLVYAVP